MDEKNAYIELVKQNRAKHRAKLKASKEIKKLEQKKEKVILKYEQAAKDNTCITFHQYCRKKWASEAGIESVPDDDETDVEWQEKLNAKQKEEDAWEDVPDVGNILDQVLLVNLPEFSHLEGGNFAAVQKTKQQISANMRNFHDLPETQDIRIVV